MELTPYCTRCGGRHWASECPSYGPYSIPSSVPVNDVRSADVRTSDLTDLTPRPNNRPNTSWKSRNPEKHRDYMREYMKRKRGNA